MKAVFVLVKQIQLVKIFTQNVSKAKNVLIKMLQIAHRIEKAIKNIEEKLHF